MKQNPTNKYDEIICRKYKKTTRHINFRAWLDFLWPLYA